VDEGTRPHIICAKRAKRLRFPSGYYAKTTPGIIGSVAGGSYGPDIYRVCVMHPGFEARRFSQIIARKWKPKLTKLSLAAVRRGLKKAGG